MSGSHESSGNTGNTKCQWKKTILQEKEEENNQTLHHATLQK